MPKIRISDLILYSLLFTAVISFPFNMLPIPDWAKYVVRIALSALLLLSYVFIIKKYQIRIIGNENKKNLLLLLPLIIVVPCNLLTLPFAISIGINNSIITSGIFFLELILTILQAINEEIIFRLFIHSQLNIKNRLLKIIASSAIFAAMHLLNLINGFNPNVFIQVAYTFGLGLILGFIYEYGESIVACFIYHTLFNVLNNVLFGVYILPTITNVAYYSTISVIAGIAIIYMLCIYFFVFRKQERNYYYY